MLKSFWVSNFGSNLSFFKISNLKGLNFVKWQDDQNKNCRSRLVEQLLYSSLLHGWQWIAGTRRGTARVPPQVFPHSSGFGVCKGEIAQSAIYFTFTAHRFDSVSVNLLWRGPVSVRLLFETEKTWLSLLHVSVTEFTDTRERDTRVAM